MRKICDLCGVNPAELTDKTVLNNGIIEYRFCARCYDTVRKSGLSTYEFMKMREAEKGNICDVCGCSLEVLNSTYLAGCPDCYREMRKAVAGIAYEYHRAVNHVGKIPAEKNI